MDTVPSPLDDGTRQVVEWALSHDGCLSIRRCRGRHRAGRPGGRPFAGAARIARRGDRRPAAAPRYAHRGPVRRLRHALGKFGVVSHLPRRQASPSTGSELSTTWERCCARPRSPSPPAKRAWTAWALTSPTPRWSTPCACRQWPSRRCPSSTRPSPRLYPPPMASPCTLPSGSVLAARLVVGADGRQSLCRQAAGISARTWGYEQSAVACTFSHQRPHRGISTEFHRPAGPFTVVPSPGNASSLVWVERPSTAEALAALPEPDFRAALEERLQGLLGGVGDIGPRAVFPLSGLIGRGCRTQSGRARR